MGAQVLEEGGGVFGVPVLGYAKRLKGSARDESISNLLCHRVVLQKKKKKTDF